MIKGILNIPFILRPVAVLGVDQNRYVASVDNYTTISYDDIVQYASKAAHIPASDISMAMDALYDALSYFVCNGHAVKLPQLGTFHFGINAKAYEDETKAGADAVYLTKLVFSPVMELRHILDNISVKTVALNPQNLSENVALAATKMIALLKREGSSADEMFAGRKYQVAVGDTIILRFNGPMQAPPTARIVVNGMSPAALQFEVQKGSNYYYKVMSAGALTYILATVPNGVLVMPFTGEGVDSDIKLSSVAIGGTEVIFPMLQAEYNTFSKEVFIDASKFKGVLEIKGGNVDADSLATAIDDDNIYLAFDSVAQTTVISASSYQGFNRIVVPIETKKIEVGRSEDYHVTINIVGDVDDPGTRTPAISTLSANGVSARSGESSTVNVGGTYNFELNGLNLDLLPDSAIQAPAGAVVTVTEKTSQRIRFTMANAQAGTFKVVNGSVTLFQMTLTAYQAAEGAATVTSIGSVANGGSMYQTAAQNVTKVVAGTNLTQLTKDNFSLTNGSIVSYSGGNLVANFNGGNGTLRVTVSGSVIYQCTVTATAQGGTDDDGGFGI